MRSINRRGQAFECRISLRTRRGANDEQDGVIVRVEQRRRLEEDETVGR